MRTQTSDLLFHIFKLLVLFLHLLRYLCIFLGQLLRILQNLLLFLLFSHHEFLQIVADSEERDVEKE